MYLFQGLLNSDEEKESFVSVATTKLNQTHPGRNLPIPNQKSNDSKNTMLLSVSIFIDMS